MNAHRFPFSVSAAPGNVCKLIACSILATMLCGCFQATNKFYSDTDIVVDKRVEGSFRPEATGQASSDNDALTIEAGRDRHYTATYKEGKHWIKLDAALFKSGTNVFVDISRIADNGVPNNPASAPTGLDMVRLATRDSTHCALRVRFVPEGVEFQLALGAPLARALSKDPSLKLKVADEHSAIILDTTERLRSFLAKVADDDATFPQKAKWVRISK